MWRAATQRRQPKAPDVVQSGHLGLQGTQSTTHYEFRLTLPSNPTDFMSRFVSAYGGAERNGHLPTPGGAVFESRRRSRQTATRSPDAVNYKQMLNPGLIFVDANDILSGGRLHQRRAHSVNTLLTNGFNDLAF